MPESANSGLSQLLRERVRLDSELARHQQLVTILFVDIVGSTRFYDRYGDVAGLAMVQKFLDKLVPTIQQHEGLMVKTIGDAILARFPTAASGVYCALNMQFILLEYNGGKSEIDQIHIRVAINCGLGLIKGNDVFGDVVNVCSRIESAAQPDEILISPSVYDQICHCEEIAVRKRAEGVSLKGKSEKLDLYEVVWHFGEPVGPAPPRPTEAQVAMAALPQPSSEESPKIEAAAAPGSAAAQPMVLVPGAMLANRYRIVTMLGRGGMGEVYRAEDMTLGQEVALKFLPQASAKIPELLEKLRAEVRNARQIAHPNVCRVYDIGESDGHQFIAMEYVDGENLQSLLRRIGRLPGDKALQIAHQLCAGLAAAHEAGVLHRDLKTSNVMLDGHGRARITDFGLAVRRDEATAGEIAGTPAFMAPEQLAGQPATVRSDLYALGLVLYELFTGSSARDVVTDVNRTPLPPSTLVHIDPAIERAILHCLRREAAARPASAAEVAAELPPAAAVNRDSGKPSSRAWRPFQQIGESSSGVGAVRVPHVLLRQLATPWAAAVFFALIAVLAFWRPWYTPPAPGAPIRLSAELGADVVLFPRYGPAAVISPDGNHLAFIARDAGQKVRMFIRWTGQLQASPLPDTEDARDPFFSPDGQWIAFFARGKLMKMPTRGGAAVVICDAPNARGGAWAPDGSIIFSPNTRTGLVRLPVDGGNPEPLTTLAADEHEVTHRWPQVLPGGKAVLFTASADGNDYENANLVVQSLTNKNQRMVVHRGGFFARYLPSGHLVFVHEATLFAAPFDLPSLQMIDAPVPILRQVMANPDNGGAQFSFSDSGVFAYLSGSPVSSSLSQLSWVESDGKIRPLHMALGEYGRPTFSNDGKRLAVQIREKGKGDIWIYEMERELFTRFTFSGEGNGAPIWSADGTRITYDALQGGVQNLYWRRADGSGTPQRLTESKADQVPVSWRRDGKVLAFAQSNDRTSWDIMTLSVEGDEGSGWKIGPVTPFANTPAVEVSPMFSPDGAFLAYTSNETGRYEVFVSSFPPGKGKWQASVGGGGYPKWSRNGKELFYRTEKDIMVVSYVVADGSFHPGKPRLWSAGVFTDPEIDDVHDLHPDGNRFVVLRGMPTGEAGAINRVTLVFNFFDELRQQLRPEH